MVSTSLVCSDICSLNAYCRVCRRGPTKRLLRVIPGKQEDTNIFVFNFFCDLIHAVINFPESFHGKKVAGASRLNFLKLSSYYTPTVHTTFGDSALVNNISSTGGNVVRGCKTKEFFMCPCPRSSLQSTLLSILLRRASGRVSSG